ncbi:uncharacterized protein EV422DRAFT_45022 [Fimicolochytrium jonesii]|uniref:uncharacterized protein n=1 Tax=Fimicolochytrium jonesii TaxID=1396493 RepID=UPI0022FE11BB|nr:uncharacterized protein EV422DRAFT_45022 [Fimicolochytrium jonesii]KAI8821505.1 hypothetical protein EV422DRAFT_45022 [Fimicolochytrium jonesii]
MGFCFVSSSLILSSSCFVSSSLIFESSSFNFRARSAEDRREEEGELGEGAADDFSDVTFTGVAWPRTWPPPPHR